MYSEALCTSGINGESCLIVGRKEVVDPREGKEIVALCPQWDEAWTTVTVLGSGAGVCRDGCSGKGWHSELWYWALGSLCRDLDQQQARVTVQTQHHIMVKRGGRDGPFRLQDISSSDEDVRINSPLSQAFGYFRDGDKRRILAFWWSGTAGSRQIYLGKTKDMLYLLYLKSVEQFDSVMWICFSVCLFFPFPIYFRLFFSFFLWSVFFSLFSIKKKGLTGLSGRQIRLGKEDMLLLSVIICLSPVLVMGYDLCFQLLLGNHPCRAHEQLCLAPFPHVSQGQHWEEILLFFIWKPCCIGDTLFSIKLQITPSYWAYLQSYH